MKKEIKGFKVTDENMKCRDFQFELNKRFKHKGDVNPCNSGFHYCKIAANCFEYYSFKSTNRVFEIIDRGQTKTEGDKSCTNDIEFVRELTWYEVLNIVNLGKDNTGLKNTGNWNTGNWNTGNWNTGNWNTGNWNTGNRNTGNRNTGNWNTGNWNTGNWNTGNWNTGNRNTGNRNTGNRNTGNWNTGNWNTGNWNTGNWNTGNRNTGDSNTGYRNGGAFCTDSNPKLILFDVQTDIPIKEWENHKAVELMYSINPNIWVWSSEMTTEEKIKFPTHETTGGYLKSIPMKEAWMNFWGNLSESNKRVFTTLPHFNKDKFFEITGIKID